MIQRAARYAFSALFLVGAVFNTLYTFGAGDQFFGSFKRNAWLPGARTFVHRLILPRMKIIMILLVAYQLLVAVLILAGGHLAGTGLLPGALFGLAAACVSSRGGTFGNLILGLLMALLAYNL